MWWWLEEVLSVGCLLLCMQDGTYFEDAKLAGQSYKLGKRGMLHLEMAKHAVDH